MTQRSTQRMFGSLGETEADAVACPTCGGHWDFATDLLGRLVVLHPVTKYIPRVAPVYEKDEGDPHESAYETKCDECGKWFTPRKYAGNSQVVCGDKCRKVRRDRKHRESEKRCKRAA